MIGPSRRPACRDGCRQNPSQRRQPVRNRASRPGCLPHCWRALSESICDPSIITMKPFWSRPHCSTGFRAPFGRIAQVVFVAALHHRRHVLSANSPTTLPRPPRSVRSYRTRRGSPSFSARRSAACRPSVLPAGTLPPPNATSTPLSTNCSKLRPDRRGWARVRRRKRPESHVVGRRLRPNRSGILLFGPLHNRFENLPVGPHSEHTVIGFVPRCQSGPRQRPNRLRGCSPNRS